jgi:hypothetical protein
LDRAFTKDELLDIIINESSPGKSPGLDGLGRQFYYTFFPEMGQLLFDSLSTSLDRGLLSESQRKSIVRLIPKKGKDKKCLENLRPISLQSKDNKFVAKAITNRILELSKSIVTNHQNSYIPGRYIGNNIKNVQYIKEHAQSSGNALFIMSIDIAAAFDSISHSFVFNVLKRIGVSNTFLKCISMLLSDYKSAVITNNGLTEFYPIEKSTMQGAPASGPLFNIVMQAFTNVILNDSEIEGYVINGICSKVSLFADEQ